MIFDFQTEPTGSTEKFLKTVTKYKISPVEHEREVLENILNHILKETKYYKTNWVADMIDFRVGDSFRILSGVRADAVVTSLPWDGPENSRRFDADELCMSARWRDVPVS